MKKVITFLLLISVLLSIFIPFASAAEAEVSEVLADLCSMTFDGKSFSIEDYPKNIKDKNVHLIAMTEYGYDKDGATEDYAIYFYFYNPSGQEFDFDSVKNKIQMGIKWDSKEETVKSDKFRLQLCDVSDDVGLKNVYLKYRLIDKKSTSDGLTMAERQASTRIYNMSGVELLINGASNATEYELGDSYIIKGFDENASKQIWANRHYVLRVNVEHTYWRSETSYKGIDWKQQLNAVYFSIPNEVLKKYGTLEAIQASWYQYESTPMLVTNDTDFYNTMLQYQGKEVFQQDKTIPYYFYADTSDMFLGNNNKGGIYYHGFNCPRGNYYDWDDYKYASYQAVDPVDLFGWLFKTEGDFTLAETDIITSEEMVKYLNRNLDKLPLLKDYDKNNMATHYVTEKIILTPDEKLGEVATSFTFKNYATDRSWLQCIIDYERAGGGWSLFGGFTVNVHEKYPEMLPIEVIDYPLPSMPIETVKATYHIHSDEEAEDFQDFVNSAYKKGETVVMLRYLQSDYLAKFLKVLKYDSKIDAYWPVDVDAFVAYQTVVLDFDILDIYCEEGTIPVVCNTSNFVGGIDTPTTNGGNNDVQAKKPDEPNWWAILMMVLIVCLVAVVLPPVLKGIVTLSKDGSGGKRSSSSHRRSRSRSRRK